MAKRTRRGVVPCIVSDRWIEFPARSGGRQPFGEPITLTIKTLGSNDKPRKLCELIVTRKELQRAINQVLPPANPHANGKP